MACGVGPIQIRSGVDDGLREVGVLGQEAVAGVDAVGARRAARRRAACRCRGRSRPRSTPPSANASSASRTNRASRSGSAYDGDAGQAGVPAGADDPDGDLAAVRDEDLAQARHGSASSWSAGCRCSGCCRAAGDGRGRLTVRDRGCPTASARRRRSHARPRTPDAGRAPQAPRRRATRERERRGRGVAAAVVAPAGLPVGAARGGVGGELAERRARATSQPSRSAPPGSRPRAVRGERGRPASARGSRRAPASAFAASPARLRSSARRAAARRAGSKPGGSDAPATSAATRAACRAASVPEIADTACRKRRLAVLERETRRLGLGGHGRAAAAMAASSA